MMKVMYILVGLLAALMVAPAGSANAAPAIEPRFEGRYNVDPTFTEKHVVQDVFLAIWGIRDTRTLKVTVKNCSGKVVKSVVRRVRNKNDKFIFNWEGMKNVKVIRVTARIKDPKDKWSSYFSTWRIAVNSSPC